MASLTLVVSYLGDDDDDDDAIAAAE